jgi:hypothetical protein
MMTIERCAGAEIEGQAKGHAMKSDVQATLQDFRWSTQPQAAAWVAGASQHVREQLPLAETIKGRLLHDAGVRFDDMIDTIILGDDRERLSAALAAGWVHAANDVYTHPGGVFPQIAIDRQLPQGRIAIDLKVESIEDFLAAWKLNRDIKGEPGMRWRRACIEKKHDVAALGVVQRLGWRGLWSDADRLEPGLVAKVLEQFRARQRDFGDDKAGFAHIEGLIDSAITAVGRDAACQLFFTAEREYWMSRNGAARAQYRRQQQVGIGWANHDHHTYRSSRCHFTRLVGLWEKLGLSCRERFYAGKQAGWGAQVMENPITGIVTFNDVDLSPDELLADFAHEPLARRQELGTVGLWCALHGEAILQAGMHHLEAQFDFEALREQLAGEGVQTMKPFTDLPHLRQAFTEGERWRVAESRVARLLEEKLITPEQSAQFRSQGAIGSHLENLERNGGFKGFNQAGVSEIIAATDPRKHLAVS